MTDTLENIALDFRSSGYIYLVLENGSRAEGAHPQEVLGEDAHYVRRQRAHEILDLHGVVPADQHITCSRSQHEAQNQLTNEGADTPPN